MDPDTHHRGPGHQGGKGEHWGSMIPNLYHDIHHGGPGDPGGTGKHKTYGRGSLVVALSSACEIDHVKKKAVP